LEPGFVESLEEAGMARQKRFKDPETRLTLRIRS
jgi:hypothetical protein